MRIRRAIVGVLLIGLAGPALGRDKATIEGLNEAFTAAFRAQRFEAMAAMYAPDALLLPDAAPLMRGREAIQAFWTKAAEGIGNVALSTAEVTPLGPDFVREVGTFRLTTKGQPPQEIAGKYVVIWRHVEGGWKLWTDIWNKDQ